MVLESPVQIRGKNIDLTPAIKDHVDRRVDKAQKYVDRITRAHVEVRTSQRHKKGMATCEVNIFVPKHTFHASETKEDLHDAIDSAFSIIERELRKHYEKIQQSRQKGIEE